MPPCALMIAALTTGTCLAVNLSKLLLRHCPAMHDVHLRFGVPHYCLVDYTQFLVGNAASEVLLDPCADAPLDPAMIDRIIRADHRAVPYTLFVLIRETKPEAVRELHRADPMTPTKSAIINPIRNASVKLMLPPKEQFVHNNGYRERGKPRQNAQHHN